MNKTFSQKEICDYLKENPLHCPVHVGDLDNMNGDDYIFLDYLSERHIGFNNKGTYATNIQIAIYTKDFINRKLLMNYVKKFTQFSIEYMGSEDGNYLVAILTAEVFIRG